MISVCVAIKNRSLLQADGRELRLFPNFVASLVRSADPCRPCELVVVDWTSDDWPLGEWLEEAAHPVPVRIVPTEGGFSRGRGLNLAAHHASGDVFFFTDADCLLCREVLEEAWRHATEGRAYFPVLYSYDRPDHTSGWWRHAGFGNCAVSRELHERVGGWPEYHSWGKEDDHYHARLRALTNAVREPVPGFFHQWHPDDLEWKDRYAVRPPEEQHEIGEVRLAKEELEAAIPPGATVLLVDEARFGSDPFPGRRTLPFLERQGDYFGAPPDDPSAIQEFERMRRTGASFAVFAWMTFWWLEYYPEFARYLRCRYPLVFKSDRLQVFDLREVSP